MDGRARSLPGGHAWHSKRPSANPFWQSAPGSATERAPVDRRHDAPARLDRRARQGELDGLRLRSLRTGPDLELDALPRRGGAVAAKVDLVVVPEPVLPAVVQGDEAVPLLGVEPLHDAAGHAPL